MPQGSHQYVDRTHGSVVTEELFGDWAVRFLYSTARENSATLFRALTSSVASRALGFFQFDWPFTSRLLGNRGFLERCGVDLDECLDPPDAFVTPRHVFERRIRYWDCRPLPDDPACVVSPADARALVGSLADESTLFLKGKFFETEELLGSHKPAWRDAFADGDYAIFRLTPDRYHYNHVPVSGRVLDYYPLSGSFHACNPGAVVEMVTPYSKNGRVVTVIDTDVPGGTGVGLVAMIEVVALMIGEVVQCYSRERYADPSVVFPGQWLERGQPKSLYRPGSSTDVLLFQPGRVRFADDLVANQRHPNARSRFSLAFEFPLVETDVRVRSPIALARQPQGDPR